MTTPAALELCLDLLGSYLQPPAGKDSSPPAEKKSNPSNGSSARGVPLRSSRSPRVEPGEAHHAPTTPRNRAGDSLNGQSPLTQRVQSLRLQGRGGPPAPRSTWLPWGLTVIALATAGVFGWRAYRLAPADGAAHRAGAAGSEASWRAARARPAAPPAASGEVVLEAKGYVIAAHQIQISPQVGGEIIWLDPNFKEGAVYKKGDKLAEIDPVIYEAQLKSAQAALRVAEVNLQQVETGSTLKEIVAAKAQLKNMAARLELSQIDERNKRAAGVATARTTWRNGHASGRVDQAAHDVQKEMLAKLEVLLEEQRLLARAQVLKAKANVEQADKQLKNCTIIAPTTGIILTKKAELGGYVNPLAFGAAGYLCEMADLRDLEVELDIQERDIGRVRRPAVPRHARGLPARRRVPQDAPRRLSRRGVAAHADRRPLQGRRHRARQSGDSRAKRAANICADMGVQVVLGYVVPDMSTGRDVQEEFELTLACIADRGVAMMAPKRSSA